MTSRSARWDGGPITLTPIGVVRSPFLERADAPRQAVLASEVEGTVELAPGRGLEDAVSDLEQWSHIWLIVWFDRNVGFQPKVLPPRSHVKRGVLATRAPYRPNPIGMSAVKLVRVEGLTLTVRGLDLLDGTPVLDVKPYVPYADIIPDANHGWLDPGEPVVQRPSDPLARYEVIAGPIARAQLDWLRTEHDVDLWPRIEAALSLGPTPHAYRRIRKEGDAYKLAFKDWRARFTAEDTRITVERIESGYKAKELASNGGAPAVHKAFVARWGAASSKS